MFQRRTRIFLLFVAAYMVLMALLGRQFHASFSQFSAQDLAALHQSVWNFANGNGLRNTLLDGPLMQSRISPFVYVVASLYAVHESWYVLNM
ncbi:hypothetical protein [Halobaculum rubrum]|uniref:hypothetical protein n=1 Tax=Halobaculum rubrum TaxID=2872158 RepID=UPI001CA43C1D|nr:hypothetical protein [Halobaculum rubrum]QZX99910.1 hypothetical protein K6T25_02030 [Halobaculum rubrum]